ncbi:MAG: Chaperone protein Skp [Legionellaceae bacterium]
MKYFLKSILATIIFFTVNATAFADVKIAVIDMREVLQKAPQMSAISSDLQKQFKPREAKMVEAQKQLQAKIEKLNRDASVMNEKDRNELQNKIISEKATLSGMAASFQQDLNNEQGKSMQNLMKQIQAIVSDIGAKNKYTAILLKDATLYIDSSLNITSQVIQQLSKK